MVIIQHISFNCVCRLERIITTINDVSNILAYYSYVLHCYVSYVKQELELLKSRNLYLTEKNESDESKLQEAESTRKELEEVCYKHRNCTCIT